jgi:hypothetical protein
LPDTLPYIGNLKIKISKWDIRKALIELEHQGFVQRIPFAGTQVTELTIQDAQQIYDVRIELEPQKLRPISEFVIRYAAVQSFLIAIFSGDEFSGRRTEENQALCTTGVSKIPI